MLLLAPSAREFDPCAKCLVGRSLGPILGDFSMSPRVPVGCPPGENPIAEKFGSGSFNSLRALSEIMDCGVADGSRYESEHRHSLLACLVIVGVSHRTPPLAGPTDSAVEPESVEYPTPTLGGGDVLEDAVDWLSKVQKFSFTGFSLGDLPDGVARSRRGAK